MNRIKIKILATFYVGFGIIDLITRFLMKFCFEAEGGMYPLLLWNPIRLVPVNIFLFGLTIYSTIKILQLDFSNALKCGIIITLLGALSFYLDTSFILSFDYISPNIGYYLEIIPLIFFSIFNGALIFCIKFRNILNNKIVLERRERKEKERKEKKIKRENKFLMIDDASKNKISLFGFRLTKRQSSFLFYVVLIGIFILSFIAFAFLIITFPILIPDSSYYDNNDPYSLSYVDGLINLLPNYVIFIILFIICIYTLIKSRRISKFYSEFESTKNFESNI